ncbi:MAG: carbonic anhydrase [Myxococcales bacterium]|nr:carbonic anhydrase [Myxococcales bacterium]
MTDPKQLIENNHAWAATIQEDNPDFFANMAKGQSPKYLWIGCADSRVPATQALGLGPGDVFVHRNVANLAVHTDLNMLTVLQYAVEHLKVEHVIVCGHQHCGGVQAAMSNTDFGQINPWLRSIKDTYRAHAAEFEGIEDQASRVDLLVRLNVATQVRNLAETDIIQKAWKAGQSLQIHGWLFTLETGKVTDLEKTISGPDELTSIHRLDV